VALITLSKLTEVIHANSVYLVSVSHKESVLATSSHIDDFDRPSHEVADNTGWIQIERIVGSPSQLAVTAAAPRVAQSVRVLSHCHSVVKSAAHLRDWVLR